MTTGAQWLTQAIGQLVDLPSAAVDAEILLESLTGVGRHRLRQHQLSAVQVKQLDDWLVRRSSGEPVQYITGQAPFRHLVLQIGPGALIPRPETELLVDQALDQIKAGASAVVDLGSGAGPLAISISTEAPNPVDVIAVEREPAALVWLHRNVELFAPSVQVIASDVRDLALDRHVDLVVANPPYLPEGSDLPSEVGDHEPPEALWGGGDGTEIPTYFASTALRILRSGGVLLMEHSDRHQDAIVAMLFGQGWVDVVAHKDLNGRPRFVLGRKP